MANRPAATFNDFILKAVGTIASSRAGKGYDLNSYFTQNLDYGPGNPSAIKSNHPPLTMCVAAVTEVMLEALNIYQQQSHDVTPFQKLPVTSWKRGSMRDIRAHIFQYAGTNCHGTAHALERFGIGKQLAFEDLLPGDFITMNRTSGSGHTAVFLGFIGADYGDLPQDSNAVKGYKYFSAQGKRVGGGFGYRWAFFSPSCPAAIAAKPRDCGIIRSQEQRLLNTGCMLHPDAWQVRVPHAEGLDDGDKELAPSDLAKYDGLTTDDE